MKNQSKFLKVAIKAAKEAEKIILKYYAKDIKENLKSDLTPVTKADIEAEQIIIKTIKKAFPSHGFFGEESVKDTGKDYLWIIDPIDGTSNYLRKIPLFGIQISLMNKGELILGVSNIPILKELMYAEKGKGAYLNNKRVKVSSIKELEKSQLLFGGIKYFEKRKLLNNLISLVKKTKRQRSIGDCWSYHLLAQGKAEIMIEAQTKIWDIAAVKVIVEEAGGHVTDLYGNKINNKTNLSLATNGKLHQLVLSHFNSKKKN